MTGPIDFERELDRWFADGPAEVADRVIDGALLQIETTAQRSAGFDGLWRIRPMKISQPMMAAAAIVVAVGLIGALVLGVGTSGNRVLPSTAPAGSPPAPSPTARPTATQSASPSSPGPDQSSQAEFAPAVAAPAGTVRSGKFQPTLTIDMPVSPRDGGGPFYTRDYTSQFSIQRSGAEGSYGVDVYRLPVPFADPCGGAGGALGQPIGPAAADLVAFLKSTPEIVVSKPIQVTIGGHRGLSVDLKDAPGACSGKGVVLFPTPRGWAAAGGAYTSLETRWVALDVDGSAVVVVFDINGQASNRYQPVVEMMAQSLRFP